MSQTYLSDNDYSLVTASVPIICVDILPVRKVESGKWQVGLIQRATGSQKGKLTILGGRIYHSESIEGSISRHLKTDLQINNFAYFENLSDDKPFMVQQYFQAESSDSHVYGFDPTKHALALTYLLKISETPKPVQEASDFFWISDIDEKDFGFNQQVVVDRVLGYLSSL